MMLYKQCTFFSFQTTLTRNAFVEFLNYKKQELMTYLAQQQLVIDVQGTIRMNIRDEFGSLGHFQRPVYRRLKTIYVWTSLECFEIDFPDGIDLDSMYK